eukprot:gene10545-21985_t
MAYKPYIENIEISLEYLIRRYGDYEQLSDMNCVTALAFIDIDKREPLYIRILFILLKQRVVRVLGSYNATVTVIFSSCVLILAATILDTLLAVITNRGRCQSLLQRRKASQIADASEVQIADGFGPQHMITTTRSLPSSPSHVHDPGLLPQTSRDSLIAREIEKEIEDSIINRNHNDNDNNNDAMDDRDRNRHNVNCKYKNDDNENTVEIFTNVEDDVHVEDHVEDEDNDNNGSSSYRNAESVIVHVKCTNISSPTKLEPKNVTRVVFNKDTVHRSRLSTATNDINDDDTSTTSGVFTSTEKESTPMPIVPISTTTSTKIPIPILTRKSKSTLPICFDDNDDNDSILINAGKSSIPIPVPGFTLEHWRDDISGRLQRHQANL